jgi:hypothetical protein
MDASDKVLLVGAVVAGAIIGNHIGNILGAVVGGFAGLGVLVVGYGIAQEVDQKLSDHYRKV